MIWTEGHIHFIDFEGSMLSGILEYGIVTLCGTEIVNAQTRLCRAIGRIRPEDMAVHGLASEQLEDCASFSEDFDLFARLRETGPLAAHFSGVENSLLKSVWPYPRTAPDFSRGAAPGAISEWGPWVDTGRLYPQIYPTLESARLEDLVAAFALQDRLQAAAKRWCPPDRNRYHAALYDALAGALLLARLAEEPAVARRSLGWLLTLSTLDPDKRDALNQGVLF